MACQLYFPVPSTRSNPGVCLVFREGVVWIAIEPPLARLPRRNHRMSALARVFARVVIWRAIAAECRSAALARPQMDPSPADLDALLALAALRVFDCPDCSEM